MGDQPITHKVPGKPIQVQIQSIMLGLEGVTGAKILRLSSFVVGFILLALWFDLERNHGFSNAEAMESAQLGRHLATGRGYTTYSIRPLTLGLLQRADPAHAADVLQGPTPDLSVAPGYPMIVASLMKILPFNYVANAGHLWTYQPELMIVAFNELLFFAAILLLFRVARRLFDSGVAWVSVVILAGSETYWKFCLSGLSTMLLLSLFLLLVWTLLRLEEREGGDIPPGRGPALGLAAMAGALVGIGSLTRYSFAWMIIPVLVFTTVFCKGHRVKLTLAALFSFVLIFGPWVARNLGASHTPFGTAGYAYLENTRPLEQDRMERSFDPLAEGHRLMRLHGMVDKFLLNESRLLRNDLPRLGGNWAWAFFLCSLLLPFRNQPLRRVRAFLMGSLVLMALAQALGQTNLSIESPEINSENLLVLLAPLVLVFGVGFFFTMLDQMALPHPKMRAAVAALFTFAMCLPLALDVLGPPEYAGISPYVPYQIQRTALLMKPDELMMSDVPWAVAWYGDRRCSWLTLDDGASFAQVCKLKPVHAIYLTERTTDRSLLTQMLDTPQSWGHFLLGAFPPSRSPQGMVPKDFPLTTVLAGYVPIQLFLSDTNRWDAPGKK